MLRPRWFGIVALAAAAAAPVAAQSFQLPAAALSDSSALARELPRLADRVIAVYRNPDRRASLDDLFRLQSVAGRYGDASRSLAELRALRAPGGRDTTARARAANLQYEVYLRAKAGQASDGRPLARILPQAFREALDGLDDRAAGHLVRAFGASLALLQSKLRETLAGQQGKTEISLADALVLLRDYQAAESYRELAPLIGPLLAEEDRRRYLIEKDIPVRTPDGATVCAMVVRPRAIAERLPALLEFTIYADSAANLRAGRRTASNGYVAVTGLTRGKGCSRDRPIPYEHDGADAAALIDWIAAQPWSDGRVGMYSGSYAGFTQWAAAKIAPKALMAIMPAVPVAPGLDVPMEGNVFWNFVYPWTFYTTNLKALDDSTYSDSARWNRLNREWYVGGRAYRDLDAIDGTPNPIFERWLDHPSYDAYWRRMIPYGREFARIKIPVLETAGYYYGGPGAALYYFARHHENDPAAEHYLVIGPYDHFRGQSGVVGPIADTAKTLYGYELDPVARIDLFELRYQWFDYLFKGAPKPELLADKVNYQVMGANVWKHAPSVAAMANRTLRFHLSAARSETVHRLSAREPTGHGFIDLTVDLADRRDVDRVSPGGNIADTAVDTWNGVEFVSDPLAERTEVSGLFSGRLEFTTNKRDFDFSIQLYELTPKGRYVQLAPYWARASYVGSPNRRRLLTPGRRQRLEFTSGRLMSRRFERGSRLVLVLSVIKQPGQQVNYGTGKDVSDETIADAGKPLTIRWFDDSFVDVPVWRDAGGGK